MDLPDEPACQYRWTRYLDIKVCSIGTMRWRGNLPPDSAPKEPKQQFWQTISDAFQAWENGHEPTGETALTIHGLLGKRTEIKSVILKQFLNAPPPGSFFFDWIT